MSTCYSSNINVHDFYPLNGKALEGSEIADSAPALPPTIIRRYSNYTARLLAAQCIVIGPVCLWAGVCVGVDLLPR